MQLLPCTQLSNFVGVNLYVDDKGQGKGSPQNMRASHICAACGLPQAILGDAFLAKMFDDQDGFERHDIRVSDIGSDASWVKEAAAINANRSGSVGRRRPAGYAAGQAAAAAAAE